MEYIILQYLRMKRVCAACTLKGIPAPDDEALLLAPAGETRTRHITVMQPGSILPAPVSKEEASPSHIKQPPPPPSSTLTTTLLPFIPLTPVQSCSLHGWLNPRRTLSWGDVCDNPSITVQRCAALGIPAATLKQLQPDVKLWIEHKGCGIADVPHMLEWPLHPVYDLRANVCDLASAHLEPRVLKRLGITYEFLRQLMHMSDDWMRIMNYSPLEWAEMGFTREDAVAMGRKRVEWVFGCDYDALVLRVSASVVAV